MNDGNNNEKETGYQYDFCPKCGALTREGTCTSCGKQWGKPNNAPINGTNSNEPINGANPNGAGYMGTGNNSQNYAGPNYNGQNYTGQNYTGNPAYGQPQGVPAYMASNQYGPVKKNNTVLIVIVCVIGALMLIGGLVFAGLVAYEIAAEQEELSYNELEEDYGIYDSEESELEDDYLEDDYMDDTEYSYDYTTIDGFDYYEDYNFYLEDDYTSTWGSNHENHTYDELQTDYYESICDCIDESQPYQVSYQYVTYESPDQTMYASISYVVLEGEGIANLEEVNAAIKEESLYLTNLYITDYVDAGYTDEIYIMIDSFVTYTDENIISIVLDEYVSVNDEYQFDLYSMNVDLQNGYILENATMLEVNSDLVEEFRTNAEWQNADVYCMEILTNEDIFELMESNALIVYYNPCGLEIGVNYYTEETDYGWITATFSDYENYISHF